jgi:hypothetical protein
VDTQSLIDRITTVFPREPLPSMTLRQALLADDGLAREISDEEWDAEAAKDRELAWPDIPEEQLLECEFGLAHLDEEAFAYYIPAFLRFALRHIEIGVFGPLANLMNFIVCSVTERSNYNLGRLKRLNDAQIDCVIDFLKLLAERNPTHGKYAEEALKAYWLTPDARRKTVVYVP